MSRYGQNPYGENLYRIVFADSRRRIVIDDDGHSHLLPKYPEAQGLWLLERWIPVERYAGMDSETWNLTLARRLGPYPERGEYESAHPFVVSVDDSNIEKLVQWVEASMQAGNQEKADALRQDLEREQKAKDAKLHDFLDDAYPAFGAAPRVGAGPNSGRKRGASGLVQPLPAGKGIRTYAGARQDYEIPVD